MCQFTYNILIRELTEKCFCLVNGNRLSPIYPDKVVRILWVIGIVKNSFLGKLHILQSLAIN